MYLRNRMLLYSISLVFISLFTINKIEAQKNATHLKIHAALEIPAGFFSEAYKLGWGIYATDYYEVGGGGSVSLSTGVAYWSAENADVEVGLWLTRLGYRQFVAPGFYLQGDGGIAVLLKDWKDGSRFTLGGGVGYLIKTKGNNGIDINLRVNRIPLRTWVGLGVGYQFKL